MNRFRSNKFNESYRVEKKGRGNTTRFSQSPLWQRNLAPKMWNTVLTSSPKFILLWGDANTAKTHYSITFGEAIPFIGNNLILVHSNNLVNQHTDVLNYYTQQGYVQKKWRVETIHQVYQWVQQLEAGTEIDEEIKKYLLEISYIVVDECHKYGKGLEAVMFPTIMNYLTQHGSLKLILGTTMTGKYINKIWMWAGTYTDRSKFTFRPNSTDLHAEGFSTASVEYIHVDKKTKIFDKQYTDSMGKRADDPQFDHYCTELLNQDPEDALDQLSLNEHKLKFRTDPQFRIEALTYQDNRVDVSIDHYVKRELGKPVLISVRGVNNAICYENQYKKQIKASGLDIIAWNGETKNGEYAHPVYKNDERQMLEDLTNPKHPLKIVIINGMLREGTNEDIRATYQCAFTPGGAETSLQVGNRSEYTVIMMDAMNCRDLPAVGYRQALKQTLQDAGIDRTPEELLNALTIEQKRLNAGHQNHKTPQVTDRIANPYWENEDYMNNQTSTTDNGTVYLTVLSKDVWVKKVEYVGNHLTKKLALHNNHQTLQQALDIAMEAVDA